MDSEDGKADFLNIFLRPADNRKVDLLKILFLGLPKMENWIILDVVFL